VALEKMAVCTDPLDVELSFATKREVAVTTTALPVAGSMREKSALLENCYIV
jgi:hypothetical protein